MPDDIQNIIYKLELDDSGYIRGVESLSASTNKFTQSQEEANKRLKTNEAALKATSEFVIKTKKDLEDYTGTNERYRKQLEKSFAGAQADEIKLTKLVNENRQAYDAATKSAQEFANISSRASQLQQQTTGGKIPVSPPPGLQSPLTNIPNISDAVIQTKAEFDQLAVAIATAEERMKGLDAESEEFKLLAPIVEQGKVALQQYDAAAKQAGQSTLSLRGQIRQGKEELVKLEQAGKGATAQYFELEKRVAKLTDEFGDQQARIKILASDTKALDFGKGAITAATSAFQAYTAVSILAGDESEELQKKTMQLFAAMQLLQSLEQLSNLTRREGVLAVHLQSAAQATYTAVVGASTGALKTFRLALLATGIGAAIAGIAFLISRYNSLKESQEQANKQTKLFKEVNQEAAASIADQSVKLSVYKTKLNDLSLSEKDRVKVAKEYNKTADETNKIDLKQIDNLTLINSKIDAQNKLILQRAKSTAALSKLTEASTKVIDLDLQVGQAAQQRGIPEFELSNRLQAAATEGDALVKTLDLGRAKDRKTFEAFNKRIQDSLGFSRQEVPKLLELIRERNKANTELKKIGDILAPFISVDGITTDETAKGTNTKKIENVFAEKLKELQAKLAEVTAKSFESEGTIRAQFKASLEKEVSTINDLVKEGKLTGKQSAILIDLTTKINNVQLNEALSQFNKKVTDARKKLNDELNDLQQKNNQDTLNLIQDDFDRRTALIDFNEKQLIADSKENTEDRLAALEFDRFLIGEAAYYEARKQITSAGELAITNISLKASQDRQDLSLDIFKKSLDLFKDAIFDINLTNDKAALEEIKILSDSYLTKKIDFEQFKKELAAIQNKYEKKSLDETISVIEKELNVLKRKAFTTLNLTEKEYDDLIKLIKQKEAELTEARTKQATPTGEDTPPEVTKITEYAEAIGQLVESVIGFWQKANEAEAAALDRSISLQEKRVEAAQRIAERGNASYLKAEEDRLKELNVARENAARKQLGIDAALQASQILVAITGAIAKIATPGIGIAETIGAIAVIVGSLATGYGLVKSLQGNQPKLFEGTKDTGTGGKEDEKGGFTATLHPHEAVIPAHRNKAYKPVVEAIYDGTVPPEHLNNFVKTYHKVKQVPQVNYERIKDAAELKISSDGKMAVAIGEQNKLIVENNDLQRQTLRAMKSMSVSANIDRDGVAIMVNEFIQQKKIDKKV